MRDMHGQMSGLLRAGSALAVAATVFALAGCSSTPTYGTGKRADKQLLEDLGGAISLKPKDRPEIAYNPRPELVKPSDTTQLPAPQADIVDASAGQWPESPEARRQRLRDEATANQDNAFYRPQVRSGVESDPNGPMITSAAARQNQTDASTYSDPQAEYRRRRREGQQGSPTVRKYLSEPPLEYRQPSGTAPTDELGEDESKKEARLKAESRKKAGKKSWKDYLPW